MHALLPLLLAFGLVGHAAPPPQVPAEITVATWNLKWFFDDDRSDNQSELARRMSAPNRQEYDWKLNSLADAIAAFKPTVLLLQEVENQKVVQDLAQRLKERHKLTYQVGFVQGFDSFTEQDVAILAQSGLVAVRRLRLPVPMQRDRNTYKDLSKHLAADLVWGQGRQQVRLTVMTVHFIAGGGETERVKQARVVHFWLRDRIRAGDNLLVLGDFNCDIGPDAPGAKDSCVGLACGRHTPETDDDLTDLHDHLPPDQRGTHASGKPLDRILASTPLLKSGKGPLVFDHLRTFRELAVKGQPDTTDNPHDTPQAERDVSDHYPLVATFRLRK